jgi:broad specificity phosphatase PhoE
VRLYLIRHGESQGNAERRVQGRAEFHLTPRGRRQAEALADRLLREPIAALYASPQARARETAEIISGRLSLPVQPDDRLMEYDLGPEISGLTWSDVQQKYPQIAEALISDETDEPRYPGEEGRGRFSARVSAALDEITARHPAGETAAVVTHGGPIASFISATLGLRLDRRFSIAIENASITCVEINEARAFAGVVFASMNDTCHLHGVDGEQPPALDLVAQAAAADEGTA